MKLSVILFECGNCGATFSDFDLSGSFYYGQFVLRSKGNKLAYLDAINDMFFKEVSYFVKNNPLVTKMNEDAKNDIFQYTYGIICCDPDPNGDPYIIGQRPPCPKCSACEVVLHNATGEVKEVGVNAVSHYVWENLSDDEKMKKVNFVLTEVISS